MSQIQLALAFLHAQSHVPLALITSQQSAFPAMALQPSLTVLACSIRLAMLILLAQTAAKDWDMFGLAELVFSAVTSATVYSAAQPILIAVRSV